MPTGRAVTSSAGIAGALLSLAAVAILALATPRAEAAPVQCAGTFRVLHDDHVGELSLPQGSYRITVLGPARPSCARAAELFARFLQDFDGDLPGPWRVRVAGSTFLRAPGVGFRVAPVGGSEGGGPGNDDGDVGAGTGGGEAGGRGTHPANGRFCPATFRVLHDDRIGRLALPAGPYWIVLLQRGGLTCGQAATLFGRFLADSGGELPYPWLVVPASAKFIDFERIVGFRVKPAD